MNSRDRVFAALERKEPDRVPLLEWSIDAKVIEAIYPGCSYFDFMGKIGMEGVTLGYEHTLSGHAGDATSLNNDPPIGLPNQAPSLVSMVKVSPYVHQG